MNIDEIKNAWFDLAETKNSYQFGEDPIDMKNFQFLLKKTYNFISTVKKDILDNKTNSTEILDYVELISIMSRYVADTCAADESEEYLFTVTCLLTSALVDFSFQPYDNSVDSIPKVVFVPEVGSQLVYNFDNEDYSAFSNYAQEQNYIF